MHGDRDQVTALVAEHLQWATTSVTYAHWERWRSDLAGLRSAAMLGLLLAARAFDQGRGVSFRTFATRVIHAQIKTDYRGLLRARGYAHASRDDHWLTRILTPVGLSAARIVTVPARAEGDCAARECLELLVSLSARGRDRLVVRLRRDGWRQNEIAPALGISEAAVSRIVDAAVARVRERVA